MSLSDTVSQYLANNVDILGNIASNMQQINVLLSGTAYLLGIIFVIKALMSLKESGEQRSTMSQKSSMKEPLIYFVVGSMLVYAPTGFQVILSTLFGANAGLMAYGPLSNNTTPLAGMFGQNTMVGTALVTIFRTIGLIAFIRGWVLIARAGAQGQQAGSMGKGMMHVIGGILAINIVGTIDMINNTIYGSS